MALVDELIANFQAAQDRARAANETRYQQGLEIFDRIIERYEEGGTFLEGVEAQLGRAQTKATAQGMQALVSSGLAGTTQAAGLGKKFEEEVGAPTRLRAQDIALQRLSGAETQKAGFIERREDIGPSFATIAGLAQTVGSRPRGFAPQVSSYDELSRLQAETSERKRANQLASDRRAAQRLAAQGGGGSPTTQGGTVGTATARRRYAAQQYAAALPSRQAISF